MLIGHDKFQNQIEKCDWKKTKQKKQTRILNNFSLFTNK